MASEAFHSINGARVLLYTPIDRRHRLTGACRHTLGGESLGPVAALAIARHEGDPGFYLYYCDEAGHAMTDTWHLSLDDARHQAEAEYEGVSETWVEPR